MIAFQTFVNNKTTVRILSFILSENKIVKSDHTITFKPIAITRSTLIKLFLRIGIFGTFLGHGINAVMIKSNWIHLITTFGFSNKFAVQIMPVIGVMDIIIAISILFHPLRIVLLWAIFWAFITALSRPIAGEPFVEFVERAANWVAPLVLLLIIKKQK